MSLLRRVSAALRVAPGSRDRHATRARPLRSPRARLGARAIGMGIVLCVGATAALPALAESIDAFGRPVAPAHTATPGTAPASDARFVLPAPVRRAIGASVRLQGKWNAQMQDALGDLRDRGGARVGWLLVALSFAYGVLHALGPGHGKTAIAAYIGSRRTRVAQAIGLSCWTAFVQAMSAVLLVLGASAFARLGIGSVLADASQLTIVSDIALCAAGLWAVWAIVTHRGCCAGRPASALMPRAAADPAAGLDAPRDGSYLGARLASTRKGPARRFCASARQSEWRSGQALLTGLASGIRPCVGAIFLLVAALAQGVFAIGVVATFAMAAGVALTVSIVSLTSLGANRAAFGGARARRGGVQHLRRAVALAGALFITAFAACQIAAVLSGVSSAALT